MRGAKITLVSFSSNILSPARRLEEVVPQVRGRRRSFPHSQEGQTASRVTAVLFVPTLPRRKKGWGGGGAGEGMVAKGAEASGTEQKGEKSHSRVLH